MPATPALTAAQLEAKIAELKGREAVRYEAWQASAARHSGVCRDSHGAVGPFVAKTEAELEAEAIAVLARQEAFETSPRGRFIRALQLIEDAAGYPEHAHAARSAFDRGARSERDPVNPAEVGRAIRALTDVPGSDARAAIRALCELLPSQALAQARQEAA